jgi:prepilin-type N-terminal cleavage/methylation domain-containing protein
MNAPMRRSGERGFTLIELIVVLAILLMAMVLGAPYLFTQIQRSKLIGTANQTVGLMRVARLEAIKRSSTGVVEIDPARNLVRGYVDANVSLTYDAGDILLAEVPLPKSITFTEPGGATGLASIRGFALVGGGPPKAVFQSDGSLSNTNPGAIRLCGQEAQGRGANYLEVNVASLATARIEIRKYKGPDVDLDWYANGEGATGTGRAWTWN